MHPNIDGYSHQNTHAFAYSNWTLPEGADYAAGGIYMDEQTAGFTVKDNVIYHAWGAGRKHFYGAFAKTHFE